MVELNQPTALELSGVTVNYGRQPVVRGVDLCLEAGQSLGIMGESGCGKSSLLRAVAGINPYWTGRITAFGVELGTRRGLNEARLIQMVFQDPFGSLNSGHTVDYILREPLLIHGIEKRDHRVQVALDNVGLPRKFRYRFPRELSGGQRQRLGIARALMIEPRILLLDEPTSALDVSVQAEILNLLAYLKMQFGLTCLLVSHDLTVVAQLCERVAFMDRGILVKYLARDQLVESGLATDWQI